MTYTITVGSHAVRPHEPHWLVEDVSRLALDHVTLLIIHSNGLAQGVLGLPHAVA